MGNKASLAAIVFGGLMYFGPQTDCGRNSLYSSPLAYSLERYNLVENVGLATLVAGLFGLGINAFRNLGGKKDG